MLIKIYSLRPHCVSCRTIYITKWYTNLTMSYICKLQICANMFVICRHPKCLSCSSCISLVVGIKSKNKCRFSATFRLFYICSRRVNSLGVLIRFAAGARNFSLVQNDLRVLGCFLYFTTFYQLRYITVVRRWLMWMMKLEVLRRQRPLPDFPSVCLSGLELLPL